MKIQGGNPFNILGAYLKGAKEVKKGKETSLSVPPPVVDRVQISGKSAEIARLSKLVSRGSDIREEKVSDARGKLGEGKKLPDAKILAESLVKSAVFDKIL